MTFGLTPSAAPGKVLGNNDLILDAWGRQKVIHDYSLFHGLWTFDVPNRVWEEAAINASGVRTPLSATGTNVTSEGGMLVVGSGTTANQGNCVYSKRHPRYQPNRGHLYSTAIMCPNPDADGIRRWGCFDGNNGVYFELEGTGSAHTLYACRKSNGTVKTRQAITLGSIDVSKGHVYDAQWQWRGVGNYKWAIDLSLVYSDDVLGTLTELSVQDPALPVCFESVTHTTTEIELKSGCVDVTTEGGKLEGRLNGSISTGETLLQADDTGRAMLGVYLPRTLTYGGGTANNTRDMVISKLTSWTRDEAAVQLWRGRDNVATNLAGLTWTDLPDSVNQYLVGGETSSLDTAFQSDRANMELLVNEWHDLEEKNVVVIPSEEAAPFYATPGDIILVVVKSIAGDDDNASTLYFSEEV